MPPRRRNEPAARSGALLDWTSSAHWAQAALPCRYCAHPTQLRDEERKAAHKSCAEKARDQAAEAAVATYENGEVL
ncbi:hypothetical protein [Streptomyces sp. Iso 434]|uniref:hypothetical protein n=1 Tax=Streptomyces sp. Iso 434 TaxID=3062272 RepID=UPI003980EB1F